MRSQCYGSIETKEATPSALIECRLNEPVDFSAESNDETDGNIKKAENQTSEIRNTK